MKEPSQRTSNATISSLAGRGNRIEDGSAQVCPALKLLLQARDYAIDAGCDIWDFAVESSCLRQLGLTTTDFRWLTCKQFVEHSREVTLPGDHNRSFRPGVQLKFSKHTCFILTSLGAEFARSLIARQTLLIETDPLSPPGANISLGTSVANGESAKLEVNGAAVTHDKPSWNCDYREVRYLGSLVKQFKLPSPNQEAILMAFEEEGWPPKIDDPLPPHPHCDPKHRLHDTIRSLNRNQKNRLLRFKGDGTGQGVLWELRDAHEPAASADDS